MPKRTRRSDFPDAAAGEIGRGTANRPDDPTEAEDLDSQETPQMPRRAVRIDKPGAEGNR
jgi:hypothetical protein